MWVGSETQITPEELSAEDLDSPPETLEFIITPPSNGHLALKSSPWRPILNFTQGHIQSGLLVFVHSGECVLPSVVRDPISPSQCTYSLSHELSCHRYLSGIRAVLPSTQYVQRCYLTDFSDPFLSVLWGFRGSKDVLKTS